MASFRKMDELGLGVMGLPDMGETGEQMPPLMKSPKLMASARRPPGFLVAPGVPPLELKQLPELSYNYLTISKARVGGGPPFASPEVEFSPEKRQIADSIRTALEFRRKFLWQPERDETEYDIFDTPEYKAPEYDPNPPPLKRKFSFRMREDGVVTVWEGEQDQEEKATVRICPPDLKEYGEAFQFVTQIVNDGPCKTFAHNRLHILEARFKLHELLNAELETTAQRTVPHRDFYNVRKIDNHVHHSACMNQKHLLRFIKYKMRQNLSEIVIYRQGKGLTLAEVFDSLGLTPYDLSVDTLDMHADKTFHRFDKFNLKYNPIGESRLREIFLKYNNHIKGSYLAEVTQQVFDDLESNKYQFAEYRISIYGKDPSEWDALAEWIVDNKLFHKNVRWLIQIPRLFREYRKNNLLPNFQTMLDNIFLPLFEVSVNPASHPKLHTFLKQVVGFDTVDDESVPEKAYSPSDPFPLPRDWTSTSDPPYSLFSYYIYANLIALKKLRAANGLSTFDYRPHSGEAGDVDHLVCTFLLADRINHGLVLQKNPPLQYLYYLAQVGISMSPLSNNLLFLEYDKNPFPRYFARGLNVTISSDDPLLIHVTKEPLMEEYSVAAQVWKLTPIDTCEIARNSVLHSGFEHRYKAHFIGNNYWRRGRAGNDMRQTNVPDVRVEFRWGLLQEEYAFLSAHASPDKPLSPDLIDPL